jgi:hypothetical protein
MLSWFEGCRRGVLLSALLASSLGSFAQSAPSPANSSPDSEAPDAPVVQPPAQTATPVHAEAQTHKFWDRTNIWLFCGVGAFRALDYASTRNFQARGRTEILLPDDVVNNSAGFAAVEAAGTAASVGISYIFHRTGHHTMERWLSIGHIAVTGFGAARNYALESKHPENVSSP